MESRVPLLALVSGALLWAPVGAAGQDVTYSGSLEYSTGEYYFTERTNTAYLVNGLSVQSDRLRLSVDVPVVWQSTPWVSYVPGGGVPTGGTQQGDVGDGLGQRDRDGDAGGDGGDRMGPGRRLSRDPGEAAGVRPAAVQDGRIALPDTTRYDDVSVGDPTLRAEVDLTPPASRRWSVALGAQVKAPLADPDQGFGTGEWDGGVDLSVTRRLASTFLFGEVGYRVLGDMDALELQDPVAYSAGVGHSLAGGDVGLLASISGYSRILEGTDPPLEAGAGLSYRLAPRRTLSVSLGVGLTESSPDVSLAAGWSLGL